MERRKFSRAVYVGPATVKAAGQVFQAEVENLSLHGAFLRTPVRVPLNAEVRLYLRDADTPEEPIEATGVVVRVEADGIGVDFREMSQPAFRLLQRLIASCSEDPALPQQELRAHLKSFYQPPEE